MIVVEGHVLCAAGNPATLATLARAVRGNKYFSWDVGSSRVLMYVQRLLGPAAAASAEPNFTHTYASCVYEHHIHALTGPVVVWQLGGGELEALS